MSSYHSVIILGYSIPVCEQKCLRVCVCVCVCVCLCVYGQMAMAQRKFITLMLWGDKGRRKKMMELSVLSFTNPFGGNTENATLALSKISTVCTHGVRKLHRI